MLIFWFPRRRIVYPTMQKGYLKKYFLIDYNLDVVLILEPGTSYIAMGFKGKGIVIIGIGEVIISNIFQGIYSNLVLYNIHVECTKDTLYMETSQVFINNCWFTK